MEDFYSRRSTMQIIRDELKSPKKNCFCLYYLRFIEQGLSFEATIILSKLLEWEGKQSDTRTFYIHKTIKEMREETGLSRYKQEKGIKILKFCTLIEVVNKGMPRKRHFLLNPEALLGLATRDFKLTKKKLFSLFNKHNTV